MIKIKKFLSTFILLLLLFVPISVFAQTYVNVYTLYNTFSTIERNESYTQDQINNKIQEETLLYPNVQLVGNPTPNYNCHSYAWYNQSINNKVWLNDPAFFSSDTTYENTNQFKEGDIFCYLSSSAGYKNIHSAVIVNNPNGSGLNNNIEVISKWGNGGLYRHKITDCPYNVSGDRTSYSVKYNNIIELDSTTNSNINLSMQSNSNHIIKIIINESGYYSFKVSRDIDIDIRNKTCQPIDNEIFYDYFRNYNIVLANLNSGIYYLKLTNNTNSVKSFEFNYRNQLNINDGIILDPGLGWLCGSQINIYENDFETKTYDNNNINIGYTRILYFKNYIVSDTSRLNYNYVCSNEDIEVTKYGTILAKSKRNNSTIIYAINYNNYDIYRTTVTINPQMGQQKICYINMTVNLYDEFYLDLENNAPFNFLQYYTWETNNLNVASINSIGYVETHQIGNVTLYGYYLLNTQVTVIVNLNIV